MALACAVGAFVLASSANAQEPSDAPIIRDEPGKTESKAPDLENGLKSPGRYARHVIWSASRRMQPCPQTYRASKASPIVPISRPSD